MRGLKIRPLDLVQNEIAEDRDAFRMSPLLWVHEVHINAVRLYIGKDWLDLRGILDHKKRENANACAAADGLVNC